MAALQSRPFPVRAGRIPPGQSSDFPPRSPPPPLRSSRVPAMPCATAFPPRGLCMRPVFLGPHRYKRNASHYYDDAADLPLVVASKATNCRTKVPLAAHTKIGPTGGGPGGLGGGNRRASPAWKASSTATLSCVYPAWRHQDLSASDRDHRRGCRCAPLFGQFSATSDLESLFRLAHGDFRGTLAYKAKEVQPGQTPGLALAQFTGRVPAASYGSRRVWVRGFRPRDREASNQLSNNQWLHRRTSADFCGPLFAAHWLRCESRSV
jgi:hypothetical protein